MTGTSVAIIVNPTAGHGRAGRHWPRLYRALDAAGLGGTVSFTTGADSAADLARQALVAGRETIVAVGGDGTVNEVVNGFFAGGRPVNPAARLGIVSCGTGADFVKTLALPPGDAAVPILAAGQTCRLDLGLATFRDPSGRPATRYFLNVADLGLGGETVARVSKTTKAFGGFVTFLWATFVTLLQHRPKPFEVSIDGAPALPVVAGTVLAANGRYFGGGMFVAPQASLTDGRLDIFILGDVPKHALILDLLPKVYRGAHVGHPKVWSCRAQHVAITSAEPVPLEIDGELVGISDVTFQSLPAALPVLVPSSFMASQPP